MDAEASPSAQPGLVQTLAFWKERLSLVLSPAHPPWENAIPFKQKQMSWPTASAWILEEPKTGQRQGQCGIMGGPRGR